MTTTVEEKIDLRRKYTEEERDALFEALADACAADDDDEVRRLLRLRPISPRWAQIIAKVMGKEYLRERFNITYANEVLGEEWLDEK